MRTILKYLLCSVVGALILSSCGSDSKKEEPVILEGLWAITEVQTYGDGALPPIIYPSAVDSSQPFMNFENNKYEYFIISKDKDTLSYKLGTYSVITDTLLITIEGVANKKPFQFVGNKLEVTLPGASDNKIVRSANKVQNYISPIPDDSGVENGDDDSNKDNENLEDTHTNDDPGSFGNPKPINLDKVITSQNQNRVDTLDTTFSQYRYYIKAEKNKTYKVNVFNVETEFLNLPDRLKYLQIIVSDVPFPIPAVNEKMEFRIKESELEQGNSKEFTTSTGYIYVEIYRYNNDDSSLKYNLEVTQVP